MVGMGSSFDSLHRSKYLVWYRVSQYWLGGLPSRYCSSTRGKFDRVELLCLLRCGGPCGKKMGERVGAPSAVTVSLVPCGGLGSSAFPFPLRRRLDLEGWVEESIEQSCNLTGHITRKFGDSVRGVEKSAKCT